jgi:hypothetical protein
VVTSLPAALVLESGPFDLKVEPSPVKLTAGGKVKIKATVARKTYQGPIEVELRFLPAGVTAPKATIAEGQSAVTIELTAAADAKEVSKADVHAVGTATAADKQQATSPNITVSVTKK